MFKKILTYMDQLFCSHCWKLKYEFHNNQWRCRCTCIKCGKEKYSINNN